MEASPRRAFVFGASVLSAQCPAGSFLHTGNDGLGNCFNVFIFQRFTARLQGDFNRDGLPDIYVGNMFSSAGNRIAYQRQFRTDVDEETRALYQRHARGNSLFQNMGNGKFQDVSQTAAVTEARWAWSSNFTDINNDGWQDLVVANGMVTGTDDTGDL